jgi:dihydrolipoamide dehydrogenase
MKDLVIIGAGPGGFDTAVFAKEQGLDVTLIEKNKIGGTCLNWGCIPTKALYHIATLKNEFDHSDVFGIKHSNVTLDFESLKKRKEDVVAFQAKNMMHTIQKLGIEYIEGSASILDSTTVKVNGTEIKTKHIIIATGSSPKRMTFYGSDLPVVVDSKGLLELKRIPKQLVVVGGGVIGLEMASIFHQFGSEVTIVEYEKSILPTFDVDIRKRATNLIKRSGIKLFTSSKFLRVIEEDNQTFAIVLTKKGELSIPVDQVLISIGREPAFGGLDLEELGIRSSRNGIIVNENKQTSIPNIFAIGDVNGELMLAHKATYDGYKVVSYIIGKPVNIRFDLVPSVVFSMPEIASVGKNEDKLEKGSYKVAKYMYRSNAKAQCMNETDGFIKMIVDMDGFIIGCHIIGAHASDLIHEVTAMMNENANISSYQNVIHAHPTLSEVIGECLKQFH